ncbi:MAG: aspartate/glutamate racemase family protein [Leptolinea sp.]
MKTIGLLGGMSWQSTTHYYQIINEEIASRLGGLHSAKILLTSVDFAEIEVLMREKRWALISATLTDHAKNLLLAGADFIVICTNTMHKVADQVEAGCGLPVLHIADATAAAVKASGIQKIGLLGTRFTMEEDFYRLRLAEKHGLQVVVPGIQDREMIDRVIFEELCLGIVRPESKEAYLQVLQQLENEGVQGVILGCTEIEMLVTPPDFHLPLFPTTRIHALAAVDFALS